MGKIVVTIKDLAFHYGNGAGETPAVFRGISFDLRAGELLCIVGPSGCGKTTLLNLIAGFLSPSDGAISFGDGVSRDGRKIGYIFQFDPLLPWRRVKGNLLLGVEVGGQDFFVGLDERIEDYLKTFNLDRSVLSKYPSELSGGMRQRVAIIQSLMYDPQLLLLDEPFASLDFYTKLRLEGEFWTMVKRKQKAAILVTHDIDEAIAIGDRVLLMGNSPEGLVREFPIQFDHKLRSPESVRGLPQFAEYFDAIWKELNGKVQHA